MAMDSSATKTYTPAEHELTQILVTELLAHQFCFPVQWIDTQDVILRDFSAERIVEVGPAETLINMAKKMVKANYDSQDVATGLRREYLSYKKNADSIYYKVDSANAAQRQAPKTEQPTTTINTGTSPLPPPATATATIAPPPAPAPASHAPTGGVSLPDKPVAAVDIIVAIVAMALKKQTADLAKDQSIKKLCGGRSTLQNEIIGDLTKEFGSLPDQPEDVPLSEMGLGLAESGVGEKLGPCMSAMVGKLASTKMPAGSGAAALRQYLDSRWGFKQGLQDRALLRAVSNQPASRLASQGQMEAFLDELASAVLKDVGIDPQSLAGQSAQSGGSAAASAISSEALEALQNAQKSRDRLMLDAYAKGCGHVMNGSAKEVAQKQQAIDELQSRVDSWEAEHGDAYEKGIQPKFEAMKARTFDSYWNWVIQDLVITFSGILSGTSDQADMASNTARFQVRATPRLLDVVNYLIKSLVNFDDGEHKTAARAWLEDLKEACSAVAKHGSAPCFRHSVPSTIPILNIDDSGKVSVSEVPRHQGPDFESIGSLPLVEDTVHSGFYNDDDGDEYNNNSSGNSFRASGSPSLSGSSTPSLSSVSAAVMSRTTSAMSRSTSCNGSIVSAPMASPMSLPAAGVNLSRMPSFSLSSGSGSGSGVQPVSAMCPEPAGMPQIKTKGPGGWARDRGLTREYLRWFQTAANKGVSFSDKAILVTGAGQRSIGAEIVRLLLSAGAKVLVTTSSYSESAMAYYEELYRAHGAAGSELVVVPFNGGSQRDTDSLAKYVYDTLGWDLDHVVPFAAVGEAGRAIDGIDGHSELSHRVMLTNLVRLLGAVKAAKAARQIDTHPTHVVLPLSPNHGIFGQDGLYAESKIGLEALLNKWWSEDWNDYLTLCGTVIGWTRGTGLMSNNDMLATGIEEDLRIRTFSAAEMAWHIVGLMDTNVAAACDLQPLMADLSGGLKAEMNLKANLDWIQDGINAKSEIRKAIRRESKECGDVKDTKDTRRLGKKAMVEVDRTSLPRYSEIAPLNAQLEGMVDLDRVVVAVGFGEVGPYGSARTRWEAETSGVFSVEGCVELAWIMGLVKYHNGPLQGKDYCGWVDAKTKAPITDAEVKARHEAYMLEHTGIRVLERQEHDAVEPNQQQQLHEVSIGEDLEPFEVSAETAEDFKREHGDKVVVTESADGSQVFVSLRKGTTLWIPKATKFRHAVAAQLPTGWDPHVYGIPEDTISQVDPVTLYAIVSTVEAFLSAGLNDPYELYQHMHVSDLGNAVGASLGGVKSLHQMFKQRFLDRQVQKDILAETFVNTTAAWVNMLLLGSSGPIRTPVGACATSLESVDTGYDLIMGGKAKAVLVGGTDAYEKDTALEFSNMQATIDADKDAARGRTPRQASRPTASSRAGFVESEGCGIQLLTTARLALDMGLPVHGIIALTHTASDKIGRSVPAPGKGVLTAAAEAPPANPRFPNPMLDLAYRRRQLEHRKRQIEEKRALDLEWLHDGLTPDFADEFRRQVDRDAERALKEALNTYGNDFYRGDNRIAPLRGALAVWGLTVDDLSVASLHGTSTVKNDINETDVIQKQLVNLGRTRGNVLPCVAQKSLLGHGKGAAGAFALNGCLQMLTTGMVPGNRNADNIDGVLIDRDLLYFPTSTYKAAGGVKAFSVTSFGFGQKGAQVVGINAKYLFAAISEEEYESYRVKVERRKRTANRALQGGIYGGKLVTLKDKNVYDDDKLEQTLLTKRQN